MVYYKDDNNRYGYDNHKKKSSDVKVQNIKCNNIIINKNGENVDQPPQDGDMTAAATLQGLDNKNSAIDEETSWLAPLNEESQGNINLDKNVVNVCINKNNNQITVGEPPTIPTPQTCEECFLPTSQDPPNLVTLLNNYLGLTFVFLGPGIFPILVGDIQGLCDEIESLDAAGTPASEVQIRAILQAAWAGVAGTEPVIERIIDCLIDLGLITPTPP